MGALAEDDALIKLDGTGDLITDGLAGRLLTIAVLRSLKHHNLSSSSMMNSR